MYNGLYMSMSGKKPEREQSKRVGVEEENGQITMEQLDEMIERMVEEKIRELIEERVDRKIERSIEEFRMGARGKMMLARRLTHPIPIRNLDRKLYMEMRRLAVRRGMTVGQLMNDAMKYYLENHDKLALKRRKLQILQRLQKIGIPGAVDPEVRDLLKKELEEELERINKRLEELENL